jgi:cytochrome c-type biogenesis protein CcmE
MQFWVRAAVLFGVTAPFIIASGFHLPWWQVFLLAFGGALLGHLVWWLVRRRQGVGLVSAIAAAVAGAVTGWMLRRGPAVVYLVEVDEVATHPGDYSGRQVRIHGYAQPGSLAHEDDALTLVVSQHDHGLRVRYAGAVPDQLRDGMEVVAGGRLDSDRLFVANTLVVKCPSNYDRNAGARPF